MHMGGSPPLDMCEVRDFTQQTPFFGGTLEDFRERGSINLRTQTQSARERCESATEGCLVALDERSKTVEKV